MVLQFVVVAVLASAYGSEAWMNNHDPSIRNHHYQTLTTPCTTTTRSVTIPSSVSSRFMRTLRDDEDEVAAAEQEEPSVDKFEIMTKTYKKIVFDEKSGRFFETAMEPTEHDTLNILPILPPSGEFATKQQSQQQRQGSVLPLKLPKDVAKKYASNEMVPTKYLFPGSKYLRRDDGETDTDDTTTIPHINEVADILVSDFESSSSTANLELSSTSSKPQQQQKSFPSSTDHPSPAGRSIVEQCYEAWNQQDFQGAANCFSDSFTYQDSFYLGSFQNNKEELAKHFQQQANILARENSNINNNNNNSDGKEMATKKKKKKNHYYQLVIDHIAVCDETGNIGTQWHMEDPTDPGRIIPFTRGCSFYTTSRKSGLIETGFRVSEMLVKPNVAIVNNLLSFTSQDSSVLDNNNSEKEQQQQQRTANAASSSASSSSIIEQYFDAWNRRDMDSALSYFTDDCIYQTEDPVFVDQLVGKKALREHLLKNAASLPTSCRIRLDHIAVDSSNRNTIGTCWHLEVNGITLPNLRGCSMYTTNPETGLLQTGYDVTEQPIKVPKQALSLLALPAKLLLFSRRTV